MPKANVHGLILAGGRGTRFWPRSRKSRAKQVLPFFGERTLIQQTVERLEPVIPPERLWVLTSPMLRPEIVRQLPAVPKRQILAEPVARNTAPAIGLIAHLLEMEDPSATLAVFPADHYITKPGRFLRLLRPALRTAAQGHLVVLGIQPRWPETGYGYIEFEPGFTPGAAKAVPTLSFREKPALPLAEEFLRAGNFYWNAGMFFGPARLFLEELRRHLPRTAAMLANIPAAGSKSFPVRLNEAFPLCDNISIDFAVMEKASGVMGIPGDDIGWNDVGSWNAVYQLTPRDREGNAARSAALFLHANGNFVDAGGKMVALLGVEDLIVVDTPDALLVTTRARAQQVGELVNLLESHNREDLL